MSEQKCEICGENGYWSEEYRESSLIRIIHPHKDATFRHLQPCTHTYESLVGEKESIIGCDCALWESNDPAFLHNLKHHPNCDGKGNHKNGEYKESEVSYDAFKPTLQLLVIDFGDTCIVRAEKGEASLKIGNGVWRLSSDEFAYRTVLVYKPFPELREVLDGEKPLVRIEQDGNGINRHYQIYCNQWNKYAMPPAMYDALSELAGKPLPVWEGGKWEMLTGSAERLCNETGVTIWRYTK